MRWRPAHSLDQDADFLREFSCKPQADIAAPGSRLRRIPRKLLRTPKEKVLMNIEVVSKRDHEYSVKKR